MLSAGLLTLEALATVAYLAKTRGERFGSTSEISALLTFVVGALSLLGDIWVAMAIGVVNALLLSEKAKLETYVENLSRVEFLATLNDPRAFMYASVYENELSTAEFKKAAGILGGLWEKVHDAPEEFLDRRTLRAEGVDAAARDFLAGMTGRYAVALYEHLFIPKPWVSLAGRWS